MTEVKIPKRDDLPSKFVRRPGDLEWGRYFYPVTITQKQALDGLIYVLYEYQPHEIHLGVPFGGFYSQLPDTGAVIIGRHGKSVTVKRDGRMFSNFEGGDAAWRRTRRSR